MSKVFVRSALNYDRDKASDAAAFFQTDISLTQQQFKDDADINVIMKRFLSTGQMVGRVRPPLNVDFDAAVDYREMLDLQIKADRSFAALPAEVRERFGNSPLKFVEFCSDEKNIDEMRKLGLAAPEIPVIVPPPMRVEVVNPPGDGGK